MAIPASSAPPRSRRCNASSTDCPRPPALTTAAITTMLSAAMIVWFTPSMIDGFASGTWTSRRRCFDVVPNESATSTEVAGTVRIPSAVRRIAGGSENTRVAIRAAGAPTPKSRNAGSR